MLKAAGGIKNTLRTGELRQAMISLQKPEDNGENFWKGNCLSQILYLMKKFLKNKGKIKNFVEKPELTQFILTEQY